MDVSKAAVTEALCFVCGGPAGRLMPLGRRTVYECVSRTCTLQFLHPQPSIGELQALYRSHYYRPHVANQENTYKNSSHQHLRSKLALLQTMIGPLSDVRHLDFGAGTGVLSEITRSEGADACGIEFDAEARSQIAAKGLPCYGSIGELRAAAPNAHFDLITAIEVIEHLDDPLEYLRLLRALLRPGGFLFLTTPNFRSLRARFEGRCWKQYQNPTHLFYFTPRSLAAAVMAAGFSSASRIRTEITYQPHGIARRALQFLLQRTGLDGDILMLAVNAAES